MMKARSLIMAALGAALGAASGQHAAPVNKNLGRRVRGGLIGALGTTVIAARGRRSAGTVAQAKRKAAKARNRARNKAAQRG